MVLACTALLSLWTPSVWHTQLVLRAPASSRAWWVGCLPCQWNWDAQRGGSGFHMEKSSGQSALKQKASEGTSLVQLWGTEVKQFERDERERLSRAVVYKVCELLMDLPDVQDLLMVTTDVISKPLAKTSCRYKTAILLGGKVQVQSGWFVRSGMCVFGMDNRKWITCLRKIWHHSGKVE